MPGRKAARWIIVSPEAAHRINAGHQTSARVPRRRDEQSSQITDGQTYTVRARYTDALTSRARVLVDLVPWSEPLGSITDIEAKREGHDTIRSFEDEWLEVHDSYWLQDDDRTEHDRVERFERHWSEKHAWVVSFIRADHEPDLLTPASRPAFTETGHTRSPHRAMSNDADPGEYQDPKDLAPLWAVRAAGRHEKARQDERSLDVQLEAVLREAHALGIDTGIPQAGIQRRITAIKRAIAQRHAA